MNPELKKILQKLENKNQSNGINITFDEKGISAVKGKDGYTPVKGQDYFTEREIKQIIDIVREQATPQKGKDYFTSSEVAEMIREISSKVRVPKDGKDGNDGRDGIDGENPDPKTVAIDAITFLESFEGDARLSALSLRDFEKALDKALKNPEFQLEVTADQIKGIKDLLPKYPPINAGGSGATFLKSLRDVDLSALTKNSEGKYVLGGGSGGVATIVAGTGITVDATDPANPIVSASGGAGLGDVVGPASAVNEQIAVFDGTTGKLIKDGGATIAAIRANTTNVTAAGALMDSEVTNLAQVKAFDSADYATAAQGAKVDFLTVTQAVNLDQMETDIAALANGMVYKGDWDASAGTFPGAGAAQTGWLYYVTVAGTVDGIKFAIGDNIVATVDNASATVYASNWSKHDQTDAVQSVAGKVGSVTLVKADVGLGDVDNTSDADKPVSTAQQTALDGKNPLRVAVSGSVTATLNAFHIVIATATFTDPTPVAGRGYTVFVRNGTATVGGTGYSTAGTIIHRVYHSGAWSNYVYNTGGGGGDLWSDPVDADIIPDADNTRDIGSSSLRLAQIFSASLTSDQLNIGSMVLKEIGATGQFELRITEDAGSGGGQITLESHDGAVARDIILKGQEDTSGTFGANQQNYLDVNSGLGITEGVGTFAGTTRILALGSSANVDLDIQSKGTGEVQANGQRVLDANDEPKLRKKRFAVRLTEAGTDVANGTTVGGDYRISDEAITIVGVGAYVDTAGTTGVTTVDINEGGTTILSTKVTIDSGEKTSETAATAPVISDSAIAADGVITIDVDGVSTTAPQGLVVWVDYYIT